MEFTGQSESAAPAQSQGEGQQESVAPQRPTTSSPDDAAGEYYKRMEQFSRKEREMVEQRKRYQGYDTKLSDLESKLARYENLRNNIERDPESLLSEFGLDVEKYSKMLMDNSGDQPNKHHFMKVSDEVKSVKDEFNKYKEEMNKILDAEREEKEIRTYDSFTGETAAFIQQNADKFPFLSEEADSDDLVFKTIESHWKNTYDERTKVGEFLSIEQACGYIDKTLANQYSSALKSERRRKALGIDFAQEKKEPPVQREDDYQQYPRRIEHPTTLSNRHSNQSSPPMSKRNYTAEERAESIKRMLFKE